MQFLSATNLTHNQMKHHKVLCGGVLKDVFISVSVDVI